MSAANKDSINHYFQEVFDEHDFSAHPEAIYNMNETGMPLKPHPPKVITAKGKKKYGIRFQGKNNKSP